MDHEVIVKKNEIDYVFDNIRELVIHSRNKVYSVVNTEMLHLYWSIGAAIMEIRKQVMEMQF